MCFVKFLCMQRPSKYWTGFLHWNGSGFGTDVNGDLTAFSKGTVLVTAVSPGVQFRCSIHICWLPNELQKEVSSKKEKSAPHPDCSVSRKVWLVPIARKEMYSPFLIQVTSTGKSKWKSNSGNLIKTKVGFPITCLSPYQAPRLNNKFFYLLEKTYIEWPDWLVGIPAISTT